MKKLICLLAVAFLLVGCSDPDVSTTAPSTTETTAAPTETVTAPTEGPVLGNYTLAADAWYTEPAYLSAEEYFSAERRYFGNGGEWLKFDGEEGRGYYVEANEDGLAVVEAITNQKYLIPDSAKLVGAELLCADGKSLYVFQDDQVLRIEMTTGQAEVLFSGKILNSVSFNQEKRMLRLLGDLVLYYATYDGGVLTVGRLYLPDGTNTVVYEQETPVYDFNMRFDETASCDVIIRMLRPEFVAAVKKEWANPDSPYKAKEGAYDLTKQWGTEEGLNTLFETYIHIYDLQNALGERALIEYTYHGVEGTVTTRVGEMCTCYFGSDMQHDHYAPDEKTVPKIKASIGSWKKGSADIDLVPEGKEAYEAARTCFYGDDTGSQYLYAVKNGIYTKLLEQPVVDMINTGSCFICQTYDDKILAISYDGTQTAQLYEAAYGELRQVRMDGEEKAELCILDGNTIVQYDLKKVRYRKLVTHDYIRHAKLTSFLYDDERGPAVFFSVVNGMYSREVFLHLETGEMIIDYWL